VLTTPAQTDLVSQIRSEPYKSEKQQQLKKQLYGITPSAIQVGGRGEKYVVAHSGFMAFDIDGIGGDMQRVFDLVKQIPYTAYCARSASGNGLWGLFPISDKTRHAQHFDAMKMAFESLGIAIDPAPRNIASLRFFAFDENAYFNEEALVFDKIFEPVKTHKSQLKLKGLSSGNGEAKELINYFNSNVSEDVIDTILTNYGFTLHHRKGDHIYYTRPDKTTAAGLSVDYHTGRRTLYAFSSNTPGIEHFKPEASGGWSASPVTILLQYECGGKDWKRAFDIMKSI